MGKVSRYWRQRREGIRVWSGSRYLGRCYVDACRRRGGRIGRESEGQCEIRAVSILSYAQ